MAKQKKNKQESGVEQSPEALNEQPEAQAEEQPDKQGQEEQPSDAASVNEALCALEEEKEEFKNALIRERADFENYKKRNAELSAVSYKNGVVDTVSAILPVLDNFDRALMVESTDKPFADGMGMIMRQLQEVLTTLGVEEIPTDCKFDPEVHDAVMQVDEEGYEPNDVVETMQKGYRLKDKILRHAMVKVNK